MLTAPKLNVNTAKIVATIVVIHPKEHQNAVSGWHLCPCWPYSDLFCSRLATPKIMSASAMDEGDVWQWSVLGQIGCERCRWGMAKPLSYCAKTKVTNSQTYIYMCVCMACMAPTKNMNLTKPVFSRQRTRAVNVPILQIHVQALDGRKYVASLSAF